MGSSAAGPLVPITAGQIRALWTIAKRRGWGKDELYAALGVESMHALSVTAAAAAIERLSVPEHKRPDWQPTAPPDKARSRTSIRPASQRQRTRIAALFAELGWPDEKARGWLLRRHEIADLAGGAFSTRVASKIILELLAARRKPVPGLERPAVAPAGPDGS